MPTKPHDIRECYQGLRNYIATAPVRRLHEKWEKFFKRKPNGRYLQFCHSQGAIHVRNALMTFSQVLCKQIHVVAIAPAAYIDKALCASVRHYVSERDFVPLLDWSGRKACFDTITSLKPDKDASWFDHSFTSPTYTDVIRENINKFTKEFG